MIEVKGLKKIYEGRCVLDLPALQFEPGKRTVLMGANGCGKSTLLRILAGVLDADEGKLSGIPSGQREVGYLPQYPYAFGYTVLKNVEMALERVPDSKERAQKALEAVGMGERMHLRGGKLSGGEAQRMAVARMIALPRKLLLLDEPTSAADIQGTDRIESALLDYCREAGCTMIFSTHAPAQAVRLADYVVFMKDGKVIEQGPAAELLAAPKTEPMKEFLTYWRL